MTKEYSIFNTAKAQTGGGKQTQKPPPPNKPLISGKQTR